MFAFFQFLACFAGCFLKDSVEAGFFYDKNTGIVETKTLYDQVYRASEDGFQIQCGCYKSANFCRGSQVFISSLERFFVFLSLANVTVDGQEAKNISRSHPRWGYLCVQLE